MVSVMCPSRAKPGGFWISLSHVQLLRVGVGLACTIMWMCVSLYACGGMSWCDTSRGKEEACEKQGCRTRFACGSYSVLGVFSWVNLGILATVALLFLFGN